MRRHARLLVAVLVIAALAVAVQVARDGDDGYVPSDVALRAAHTSSERAGLEPAVARCIVGELSDEWSPADKRALVSGDKAPGTEFCDEARESPRRVEHTFACSEVSRAGRSQARQNLG